MKKLLIIFAMGFALAGCQYKNPNGNSNFSTISSPSPTAKPLATFEGETELNLNSCQEFDELASFVRKHIAQPYSEINEQTILTQDFKWRRHTQESFITYPSVRAASFVNNPDAPNNPTHAQLKNQIKLSAQALQKNLPTEIKNLGFTVDQLNTLPLQQSGSTYVQVFALTKGTDLYSIILQANLYTQSVSDAEMAITCGHSIPFFDRFYDTLGFKHAKSVPNPFINDWVSIQKISPSGKIIGVWGDDYTNRISITNS